MAHVLGRLRLLQRHRVLHRLCPLLDAFLLPPQGSLPLQGRRVGLLTWSHWRCVRPCVTVSCSVCGS